jgi:septum formation protein
MNPNVLLLASNSPRRRQLLNLGGWGFDATSSDIDETVLPNEAPGDYVQRLACEKARASSHAASNGQVVIGSDTTVVIDGEILGKPKDSQEAVSMLKRLRGRTHQVYTGIAAYSPTENKMYVDLCITDVPMRPYSDEEIMGYVATDDPLDKAGAYAIQHEEFRPVASMAGCYASVMGLPLCHLARLLREFGIQYDNRMPEKCQALLDYQCPVHQSILG